MAKIEQLRFLTAAQAKQIAQKFGTPVYVYSEKILRNRAQQALKFSAPYGLTVRYAMKANANRAILQLFNKLRLHIDASSGGEAERAMFAGLKPEKILLTSQETPANLKTLVEKGVLFNAGSLRQLEGYGRLFPNSEVSVRINPGLGAGLNNRLNTAGPNASFGIWHEYIDQINALAKRYKLKIVRVHNNIGTGSDPELWQKVVTLGLRSVEQLPDVRIFNAGGGLKVPYMQRDLGSNLAGISTVIAAEVEKFAQKHGRKLHLEIEPGRFLVAEAGSLLSRVQDMTDTGEEGYTFLKLDTGMTEIIRPAMYGAQHPIVVINGNSNKHKKYIVVGHCCETSDTLTPEIDDPEAIEPRLLQEAKVGDLVAIEVVGAYCATMSAINYHTFPQAPEVFLKADGRLKLVRRRQTFEEMLALERG